MTNSPDIIYTKVDEAPELASASFLPIIRRFASAAGVAVGVKDISLAGRIIATFPDHLTEAQRQDDHLAELGELVKTPDANVIKLPNISASVPQLVAAVQELQAKGYALPDYPEDPQTDAEKDARARYDSIKGSAVNPVLREGNSDRRAARAVKNFAQANPHSMGAWEASSKTKVSSMPGEDFYANEVSATITATQAGDARIEFEAEDGTVTVLKDVWPLEEGTVADATFMSAAALSSFLRGAIEDTKTDGTMFSLHMKATMMKVSDPIIFGHAVRVFFADLFGIQPTRWLYGMPGVLIAQTLAFTPIAYLVLIGVVEGVSPSMEDAAQTLRANRWQTFRTESLPLMRPGLANAFLLGFIESMADFGNPLVLGGNFDVLSTEIFFAIVGAQYDQGRAAVLALVLLFFTLSAFYAQRAWLGKKSYTTVTGKVDAGVHP